MLHKVSASELTIATHGS